jgi:hypothetical protein
MIVGSNLFSWKVERRSRKTCYFVVASFVVILLDDVNHKLESVERCAQTED